MILIRSGLYIGKAVETYDRDLLARERIDAMLQLAAYSPQPGIESLHIDIDDGVPLSPINLADGVAFIQRHQANDDNVLVACGAGISRSSTFVIASLKEAEDLGLLAAFCEVAARHPAALPHPALWKSLCTYYSENVPYLTILREHRSRQVE